MAARRNVIVIGGSFDGLVTAAYLARAGRSVVVLEPSDRLGGALGTEEIAPGCRAPVAFPSLELLHPDVVSDLDLLAHGYEPITGGGAFLAAGSDSIHLDPAAGAVGEQIRAWSPADAAAYDELEGFHGRVGKALERTLTEVLPDPVPSGLGSVVDLLQVAWRLRRLGAEEMPEAMRYLPMPIKDVLDERFESEGLRCLLAGPALTAAWLGPRSAGSTYGLLHHRPARVAGLVTPRVTARGGPGNLVAALTASLKAAGGEIRLESPVTEILVEDGKATGVRLADGSSVQADNVVSSYDPSRTLLDWVDPEFIEPQEARLVQRTRGHGSVAVVRYVTDSLPRFEGAPSGDRHLTGVVQVGSTLDHLERAFDSAKRDELPTAPWVDLSVPTLLDSSLAPEGRHIIVAWAQYISSSAGADAGALGDLVSGVIEGAAPGFTSSIQHRDVVRPADLESRFGLPDGCLYQVDLTLDQLLHLRPMAGWFDHTTPVEDLYLCGPACHPGGGITGLPGRNAARRLSKSR